MARLVDVCATIELDPIVGGVAVMDFSEGEQESHFPAQPVRAIGGSGARLDRSLELVDWFSLIDAT
jgi:hypothetical protein